MPASALEASRSGDRERAAGNGRAGVEPSPVAAPWWLAAAVLAGFAAIHASVVWTYGGRAWGQQPWWIHWLHAMEGAGATVFATLATLLVVLIAVQTLLDRTSRSSVHLARVWFVVLAVFVVMAGTRYFIAQPLRFRSWVHAHDSFHYVLGPKYLKEIGYDGLYACAVELAPPGVIPPTSKVRDLRTYTMRRAKSIVKQRECRERVRGKTRARLRKDLALWAGKSGGLSSPAAYRGMVRDLGYNGTPTHTFFARSVSRSFELTPRSLARAGLIDVALITAMLVYACWVLGAEWGLLFAAIVFTSVTDRFGFTGGSFLRYAWYATLVVGVSSLHRERGFLAGFWTSASTLLNVFPGLFALGTLVSVAGDAWRRRSLSPFVRRVVLGFVVGTALFGGLGMAHSHGPGNYVAFSQKMARHLGPAKRGEEHVERLPGFGASLKTVVALADVHFLEQPADLVSVTKRFGEIKWIYRLLSVGLFGWALALAWRLDPLRSTALVGFVGAFTTMTLLGYYLACVSIVYLSLLASTGMRDRTLLLLLCACNAAAAIRFAQTLQRFELYNFSLSHAWLAFIVVWLTTWTVSRPRRPDEATTAVGPVRSSRPSSRHESQGT